ncbi:MAG: AI-2E family transporter, partial [Clostridiaceae bacterium]|nr:AI-2E family transporter [Clostridiaceae bacterium]
MNNIWGSKKVNIRLVHIIIIAVLIFFVLRYGIAIGTVVKPFIIAAVFSYLLNPVVKVFEKKGIRRIFGVIIVYLIFIAIIMLLAFVLVPKLIKEISALVVNIP